MEGRYNDDTIMSMFNELSDFKKISPMLIQKRYGLNEESAHKICCKIWLLRNIEARNLAKGIEYR